MHNDFSHFQFVDAINHKSLLPTEMNDTLDEADRLKEELDELGEICLNAQLKPEIKRDVEQMSQWLRDYSKGLAAAHQISDSGVENLNHIRVQVHAALDELLRLEDEGGRVATSPSQVNMLDELMRALHRIDRLRPAVEAHFSMSPGAPNIPDIPEPATDLPAEIDHSRDDDLIPRRQIEDEPPGPLKDDRTSIKYVRETLPQTCEHFCVGPPSDFF